MHISAGGVVYQRTKNQIKIILLYRQKSDSYHLPKGTRSQNETIRQTAQREIKEETGCQTELKKYLGKVYSGFERNGKIIKKQTHYFLAKPISVCLVNHDKEHNQVFFIEIDQALALLKQKGGHIQLGYENEIKILKKAKEEIRNANSSHYRGIQRGRKLDKLTT